MSKIFTYNTVRALCKKKYVEQKAITQERRVRMDKQELEKRKRELFDTGIIPDGIDADGRFIIDKVKQSFYKARKAMYNVYGEGAYRLYQWHADIMRYYKLSMVDKHVIAVATNLYIDELVLISVQRTSRSIGVNRSSIYRSINRLKKKNLIHILSKDNIKKLFPEKRISEGRTFCVLSSKLIQQAIDNEKEKNEAF